MAPINLPRASSNGPPLLPGLMAASVCTRPFISRPVMPLISRPRPPFSAKLRIDFREDLKETVCIQNVPNEIQTKKHNKALKIKMIKMNLNTSLLARCLWCHWLMSDPNQRDFQWQKLSAPPEACRNIRNHRQDCGASKKSIVQPCYNQSTIS